MLETSMFFIQGEADPGIEFTITDNLENPVNLSSASIDLKIKNIEEVNNIVVTKNDSDFDKTNASNGIIKVGLTSDDLNQEPGVYIGELIITFNSNNISKNQFYFKINKQV